jgi:hypothetical protein
MIWPSLLPFNIGSGENPYLQRWFVLPRNRWFCIYLHKMLRDDDDRALHDHPGANVSIVLRGGYDEWVFLWRPVEGAALPRMTRYRRRPGRIIFRSASAAHRLALPPGVKRSWSMFIILPKRREWGFWCGAGTPERRARWVHWKDFTAGPRGEIIGKGCG